MPSCQLKRKQIAMITQGRVSQLEIIPILFFGFDKVCLFTPLRFLNGQTGFECFCLVCFGFCCFMRQGLSMQPRSVQSSCLHLLTPEIIKVHHHALPKWANRKAKGAKIQANKNQLIGTHCTHKIKTRQTNIDYLNYKIIRKRDSFT